MFIRICLLQKVFPRLNGFAVSANVSITHVSSLFYYKAREVL